MAKKVTKKSAKDFRSMVKEDLERMQKEGYPDLTEQEMKAVDFGFDLCDYLLSRLTAFVEINGEEVGDKLGNSMLMGVARFVAFFLNDMQKLGVTAKGKDIKARFVEDILPVTLDLVDNEIKEREEMIEFGERMREKLSDENLSLENVYEQMFEDDANEEIKRKRMDKMADIREKILKEREKKCN